MADVYELDPGPIVSGKSTTAEKRYIVLGAGDDEDVAYAAVASAAPGEYAHPSGETLPIAEITLDESKGNGVWMATARYDAETGEDANSQSGTGDTPSELPQPPADSENLAGSMSFTTLGGTIHITQSLETRQAVAVAGAAPDNKQAIGVHGDSDQIDGTDIVAPKLEITLKRKFAQVTTKYLRVLRDLTGTVNTAKFMRFDAGEVLFMGATGDQGADGFDVSFQFAITPNEATVAVATGLTITSKKGWEYIWASYSPAKDGNALTRHPIYAFLERVYRETDFKKLGIFADG